MSDEREFLDGGGNEVRDPFDHPVVLREAVTALRIELDEAVELLREIKRVASLRDLSGLPELRGVLVVLDEFLADRCSEASPVSLDEPAEPELTDVEREQPCSRCGGQLKVPMLCPAADHGEFCTVFPLDDEEPCVHEWERTHDDHRVCRLCGADTNVVEGPSGRTRELMLSTQRDQREKARRSEATVRLCSLVKDAAPVVTDEERATKLDNPTDAMWALCAANRKASERRRSEGYSHAGSCFRGAVTHSGADFLTALNELGWDIAPVSKGHAR